MDLTGRQVTVALRDAPLVPTSWGRHVGVPAVVVGRIAEMTEQGIYLEPIDVVHLNNGNTVERDKGEIPFHGILVPWRSVSSVATH